MNRKLLASIPLLLATAGLFAASNSSMKKNSKKGGEDCAPLCYAGPVVECEPYEITAAAVYQQMRLQGQEIAIETGAIGSNVTNLDPDYNPRFPVGAIGVEPQEDFNWGFKVGGTYRLSYDDWKVGVMYSYLKTIVNEPIQAAYGKGFFPSQYANQAVNNYDDGELLARRSFQNLETGSHTVYNDVHFTLERPTLITKDLEVTPFYGIDASFFSRRQTVVFTNDGIHLTPADTNAGIYLSDDGFYYQNYQKIQWWGVGPMIGVHTSWYLAYDVSFYGDAYTALEYGRSSSRTATLSKDYSENANPNEASIENFLYQFSPNYSFQLGLNWTRMLEEFDVRIGFNIGYESTYYSQVIKTLVPEMNYRVQNGSGLGIQGLVLQGTLDF